jgi:hypothetical protein
MVRAEAAAAPAGLGVAQCRKAGQKTGLQIISHPVINPLLEAGSLRARLFSVELTEVSHVAREDYQP